MINGILLAAFRIRKFPWNFQTGSIDLIAGSANSVKSEIHPVADLENSGLQYPRRIHTTFFIPDLIQVGLTF